MGEIVEEPPKQDVVKATEEKTAVETGKEEPSGVNFTEAAKANAVAAENATPAEAGKPSAAEGNGYVGMRKPLISRFNPRGPMVFSRNGLPRKNADLRAALNELKKTAEPKPQSGEAKSELQDDVRKPEENKES